MKTNRELIACVKRELSLRVAVYPRRVTEGKLTQEAADHQIECMRKVLAILEEREKDEGKQRTLEL